MYKQLGALAIAMLLVTGCGSDSGSDSDSNNEQVLVDVSSYTGNVTTDFSTVNNPNNAWSYGEMTTSFTDFSLLSADSSSGIDSWFKNATIYINTTDSIRHGAESGQLVMHPGSGELPAVVRWTAPEAGEYSIIGEFGAGDSGFMQVGIRKDNDFLFQAPDSGTFDLNVSVQKNEVIDFVVYGGYYYGTTTLDVVVTKK